MRFVVDGFQHEAEVVLALGGPQKIVRQVIILDLLVLLGIQKMPLKVKLQYLLLPDLQIKAACESDRIKKSHRTYVWRISASVVDTTNVVHHPYVVLDLLLTTADCERFHEVFGDLLYSLLALELHFVFLIELPTNTVLAVVHNGRKCLGK